MTWTQRQQRGECCYPGCGTPLTPGSDYCVRHLFDKRRRNKKHMRIRRAVRRVQLGLGL